MLLKEFREFVQNNSSQLFQRTKRKIFFISSFIDIKYLLVASLVALCGLLAPPLPALPLHLDHVVVLLAALGSLEEGEELLLVRVQARLDRSLDAAVVL